MSSVEWFSLDEPYESIGTFPAKRGTEHALICPQCGKLTEYWEGVVGNDSSGDDLRACCYQCWDCRIDSESVDV